MPGQHTDDLTDVARRLERAVERLTEQPEPGGYDAAIDDLRQRLAITEAAAAEALRRVAPVESRVASTETRLTKIETAIEKRDTAETAIESVTRPWKDLGWKLATAVLAALLVFGAGALGWKILVILLEAKGAR